MYLSQRGFYLPRPEVAANGVIWFVVVIVAVVGLFGLWWYAGRREADGRPTLGLRWIAQRRSSGFPCSSGS